MGLDMESLLDMDVLSFNALSESGIRVRARQSYEQACIGRAAAQADQKSFQKFTKQYSKVADGPKTSADLEAKFGGGF